MVPVPGYYLLSRTSTVVLVESRTAVPAPCKQAYFADFLEKQQQRKYLVPKYLQFTDTGDTLNYFEVPSGTGTVSGSLAHLILAFYRNNTVRPYLGLSTGVYNDLVLGSTCTTLLNLVPQSVTYSKWLLQLNFRLGLLKLLFSKNRKKWNTKRRRKPENDRARLFYTFSYFKNQGKKNQKRKST